MTSAQAVDTDTGSVLAGGGGDAVLAAAMLGSARLPADTVARVAGAVVRSPDAAARHLVRGLRRQLAVAVGTGEQLPDLDRRFTDAAWHTNPALRRLAQSYLVWCDALRDAVDDTPLETRWTTPHWNGAPGSGPT